jgi:hypothetical protein
MHLWEDVPSLSWALDAHQQRKGINMNRQEQITLQQVVCKKNEATSRCMKYLDLASQADNNEDFVEYLALSAKAANDAQTWTTVYNNLTRKG